MPTAANGLPAFGQYRPSPGRRLRGLGAAAARGVDGQIVELSFFLDTPHVFPLFGLPARLDP